jgi:putative ABC transport system permease protein
MALGATTNNILTQFILEAVIICLSGGILGAGLGMLAAKMVGIGLGWPVFISQKAVLISLVSAAGIGLFFGYYPAYKASQLNPIDALVDH